MIYFENIQKSYGNEFAVCIDKLDLSYNKIYGFLGPNGAGKTTTIRMMIGLLKPDNGKIFINKKDIMKNIEQKAYIGYVPDEPNLYENLTAYEHLNFIMHLYKTENKEQYIVLDELMHVFDIYNHKDEIISTFSKGMKQKISIISALIHNPKILVLDEPFTGLDPVVIKKFKNYLKKFIEMEGNGVFFSTHDLDVADNICTDAIIINNGKVIGNYNLKKSFKMGLQELFFSKIESVDII